MDDLMRELLGLPPTGSQKYYLERYNIRPVGVGGWEVHNRVFDGDDRIENFIKARAWAIWMDIIKQEKENGTYA